MKAYRYVFILIGLAVIVESIMRASWLGGISGILLVVDSIYGDTIFSRGRR